MPQGGVAPAAPRDAARVVDAGPSPAPPGGGSSAGSGGSGARTPSAASSAPARVSASRGSGSSWMRLQASTWSKPVADLRPPSRAPRAGPRRSARRAGRRAAGAAEVGVRAVDRRSRGAPARRELGGHQAGGAAQLQHALAGEHVRRRCARSSPACSGCRSRCRGRRSPSSRSSSRRAWSRRAPHQVEAQALARQHAALELDQALVRHAVDAREPRSSVADALGERAPPPAAGPSRFIGERGSSWPASPQYTTSSRPGRTR